MKFSTIFGRLLYMGAGEAAKIAQTYINMHKYALNAHIYAYILYIPLYAHYGSALNLALCSLSLSLSLSLSFKINICIFLNILLNVPLGLSITNFSLGLIIIHFP